ncbi:Adenylate-forming reductase Nps10 [Psilocybe cubensis]|uniref:AMP-dependent synthetase/ligase domain-containing protein n=2 Tax=Psilocybe cubensis TaxID=181762 RepID=A0A8H7XPL0_PSICU|nr:Adenylate-forming reductase Nps10 [Psilocybe cubensis]KAH9474333.1 Adenylate-forming reductase Nps10 [Psilocybe cubensis]
MGQALSYLSISVSTIDKTTIPTFVKPPTELNIEYVFDFHLENNPTYTAFQHPDSTQSGTMRYYTYAEVVPAIHRAGGLISTSIGRQDIQSDTSPVVAVFAEINNLTYATHLLGLLRAGITAFLISPRFHSTVVAELLRMARPTHVLVSDNLRDIALQAVSDMHATKSSSDEVVPVVVDLPPHEKLYPGHNSFDRLPRHHENFSKKSLIVHSSSSTSSCPKIIPWTSNYIRANSIGIAPSKEYSDVNFEGKVLGGQSAEFFHTAGLYILFGMPRVGFIMAVMPPADPRAVIPANRDMVYEGYKQSQIDIGWASPRFLEAWSKEPENISYLSNLDCIIYGGSALSKAAGDKLSSHGVKLCNAYGATEVGAISKFVSEPQTTDWEYFNLNPGINYELLPREDGLFEAVIVYQKGYHEIPVCEVEWKGKPAYACGDLLTPHPIKRNFYKVVGRNKDMILLSSGQAVNPVYIEDALRAHPDIKDAVIFGQGRPFLGILVSPNPSAPVLGKDREAMCDRIWAVIEEYNKTLPDYSRLRKEAFLLSDVARPFLYGEKGLSKRSLILDEYRDEVEKCYMNLL